MPFYYFRDTIDTNGYNEVHTEECSYLPSILNRTYIGYEDNCSDAIRTAEKNYPFKTFDGCFYCSNSCHNG